MTLTSAVSRTISSLLLLVLALPVVASAQSSVTLSVSPTLFEMSANPDQSWSSAVRVINTNAFPLKVYASAVNFEPVGESGQGSMMPVLEQVSDGSTLAEWISLPKEEIIIPAEQTISVPFTISVPSNAAPGGHFAAVLVGTRPLTSGDTPALVSTSQIVTSLVLLRVAGDITERGMVRDFTTTQSISESPQATFNLRFQNSGNVHLQPQGTIIITNMWGKERGVIPINQASQFGNVLPESIRQYTFEWIGEWSLADIGRYTAEATLAYGDDSRQFVNAVTHFWVIPWRALLLVILLFGGFVWLVIYSVKLYIRRMLQLAGVTPELQRSSSKPKVSITAPLERGILDLRSEFAQHGSWLSGISAFAKEYRLFLVVCSAVLVFLLLFVWYLVLALSSERGYQVRYEQNGEMVEVAESETPSLEADQEAVSSEIPTLPIALVNRSGVAGLDELLLEDLQQKGYNVTTLPADYGVAEDRTVIIYDPEAAEAAVALQAEFPDALLSSFVQEDAAAERITVYLGTDQL